MKPFLTCSKHLFHRRCLYSTHTLNKTVKTYGYCSNTNKSFAISSPQFFQHRSFTKSRTNDRKVENRKEKKRKVCLIVGAGAGIGEALTRRFTKGGYTTGK